MSLTVSVRFQSRRENRQVRRTMAINITRKQIRTQSFRLKSKAKEVGTKFHNDDRDTGTVNGSRLMISHTSLQSQIILIQGTLTSHSAGGMAPVCRGPYRGRYSRLLYYLIREIKTWLTLTTSQYTISYNTYCIF